MFLTQSELTEMTGYQKYAAQQRWLKEQRIPFLIGGDGMPRVLRATVLGIFGGHSKAEPAGPQLRFKA